jgi:hypothetical protein
MSIRDDTVTRTGHAAKCPYCGQPHHYVEVSFHFENDRGYWEVDCSKCKQIFVVELNNPKESGGKLYKQIKEKREGQFAGDRSIVAHEVAKYDIDLNQNTWNFNYSAASLYQCAKTLADLECPAKSELEKSLNGILSAYRNAQNNLTSRGPDHDYSIVRLPVKCLCGGKHTATFYMRLLMDPDNGPTTASDFLLADVSGAKLDETLDGIVSKDDAMDLLEKLVIRWNLLAEQILIVSPFVGTTYTSSAKQLVIWEWLLGMLDSAKSVFLTRGATWTGYKKAMDEDGIPVDLLEKFGLDNKLVAMDIRKQDFHAKFYAGISEYGCEVMSGSANLVRGQSVENIGFRTMDKTKFDERYIERLKLKKAFPVPKKGSKYWVLIDETLDGWRSVPMFNTPYLELPKLRPDKSPAIGRAHPISIDAATKIRGNAVDFLNGGLELLFADDLSSKTAKVSVISIQTSVELLAKYRLVREDGLQAIVRGKFPSANVEKDAKEGNFNTIGFGDALNLINQREMMQEFEVSLIKELANLRNTLIHFSSEIDPQEVKYNCVHILARVLAMFALGEERDVGEMEDYRRFLSDSNFLHLTNFEPYRAESADAALENLDTKNVMKCYQCGNESFSLRASENYFCHCCGLGVIKDAIEFADCDACGSKSGVFFDPLNSTNGMHFGKCMDCQTNQWSWICAECGTVISQLEGRARRDCPEC